jgi:DNA recombination protein RmuC
MVDALTVWVLLALAVLNAALLIWLALRAQPTPDLTPQLQPLLQTVLGQLQAENQRLRADISQQQHQQRSELTQNLAQLAHNLGGELRGLSESNAQRLQELRLTLEQNLQSLQTGNEGKLELVRKTLDERQQSADAKLERLTESNAQRLQEVRATLEQKLQELQTSNEGKLELMRQTVDEKLHATLEQRLGDSFKLVSERLELVHKGLGEMQSLASGVGDLKRVLTNVKTRGGWGEVQLEAILEQFFTAEQFAKQAAVKPGSAEKVDCAIRLPGRAGQGAADDNPVWLPIDAKFPMEDYERLLDAQDRADLEGIKTSGAQLERAVRQQAKSIADKYIAPPHTTDFALLFLPNEGLYAEVVRRPGLVDTLQREQRVVLAGPTTLAALLNSLQMGFRTLAIEQRSSEVWQILGAVKTEFGKFGEVLDGVKKKLEQASDSIDKAGIRTRAIERKLRDVEALPEEASQEALDTP